MIFRRPSPCSLSIYGPLARKKDFLILAGTMPKKDGQFYTAPYIVLRTYFVFPVCFPLKLLCSVVLSRMKMDPRHYQGGDDDTACLLPGVQVCLLNRLGSSHRIIPHSGYTFYKGRTAKQVHHGRFAASPIWRHTTDITHECRRGPDTY